MSEHGRPATPRPGKVGKPAQYLPCPCSNFMALPLQNETGQGAPMQPASRASPARKIRAVTSLLGISRRRVPFLKGCFQRDPVVDHPYVGRGSEIWCCAISVCELRKLPKGDGTHSTAAAHTKCQQACQLQSRFLLDQAHCVFLSGSSG